MLTAPAFLQQKITIRKKGKKRRRNAVEWKVGRWMSKKSKTKKKLR
jgi:hypothetical protein